MNVHLNYTLMSRSFGTLVFSIWEKFRVDTPLPRNPLR
jgi:hypothetical protein